MILSLSLLPSRRQLQSKQSAAFRRKMDMIHRERQSERDRDSKGAAQRYRQRTRMPYSTQQSNVSRCTSLQGGQLERSAQVAYHRMVCAGLEFHQPSFSQPSCIHHQASPDALILLLLERQTAVCTKKTHLPKSCHRGITTSISITT